MKAGALSSLGSRFEAALEQQSGVIVVGLVVFVLAVCFVFSHGAFDLLVCSFSAFCNDGVRREGRFVVVYLQHTLGSFAY